MTIVSMCGILPPAATRSDSAESNAAAVTQV
jgi:hypothetical protein